MGCPKGSPSTRTSGCNPPGLLAYQRFFQKLGGRPKIKKKAGRQAVWITAELFRFISQIDETGEIGSYQLTLGTDKFPVGVIPYVAHRSHAVPSSIHITVEGGHWWLSFAAEDSAVDMPGRTPAASAEQIAEDLRHLSSDQLAERTLGGNRGVAKPLMTPRRLVGLARPATACPGISMPRMIMATCGWWSKICSIWLSPTRILVRRETLDTVLRQVANRR